jgi:hypothetical protein
MSSNSSLGSVSEGIDPLFSEELYFAVAIFLQKVSKLSSRPNKVLKMVESAHEKSGAYHLTSSAC